MQTRLRVLGHIVYSAIKMEYDFENDETLVTKEQESPLFRQQTLEESLASLYKPPYSKQPHSAPTAAPVFPDNQSSLLSSYQAEPNASYEEEPEKAQKNDLWSLLTMSLGGMLLTLGLLLFFFSDGGVVTLEWDADKWFLYCLAALPMIYFGLRISNRSDQ